MDWIWFLLIGLAAGWLAGQIMKGGGFGLLGDLIIGVIGELLGGFLFGLLHISAGGLIGELVTATVGAIVLLLLLRNKEVSAACSAQRMSALIRLRKHNAAGGFAGEDAGAFGAAAGLTGQRDAADGNFEVFENRVDVRRLGNVRTLRSRRGFRAFPRPSA